MGVENYYISHGNDYRNPHERKINLALRKLLFNHQNEWMKQLDLSYVLDLCCGSGEMTIFLKNYMQKHQPESEIEMDSLLFFFVDSQTIHGKFCDYW